MTPYSLFASLAPAAFVLLLIVARALWRRRAAPGGYELVGVMVAGAVWLAFAVGEVVAPTPRLSALAAHGAYLAIPWGPLAWFAFAVGFTGRRVWRNPAVRLVAAIGAVTMALGVSGSPWLIAVERSVEVGSFRYNEVAFGPWFWVHIASSWLATAGGAVLVALEFARSPRPIRRLSLWLVVAAVAPLAVNVTYAGGVHAAGKLYTPLSFSVSALAFGYGMIRYRLLDLRPATRSALVERVSEGIVVLDPEGRVVDANGAFVALAPEAGPGRPLAGPLAALETGAEGEVSLSGRVLEWRADAAEHGVARVVVLRDVTARREAENALRRANAELRLRTEELDAFAHTVAHDLKGPLQAISGSAEIAALPGAAPEAEARRARALGRIGRTVRQMDEALDGLLALARVRHEPLEPRPLAMGDAARRAVEREANALEGAEVTVPEAWPVAVGHAPWVEAVWANLLANAARHGGRRIALGWDREAAPGLVRFWVDDDGPGVPPEARARVLAPMARLHPEREGSGLGLSIVARVVDRLGGGVEIADAPLGGARVAFTLPEAPEASGVAAGERALEAA